MLWLRADEDDTPDPADRTVGDTSLGEKSTDTKEDVFKAEHDRAMRDALEVSKRREAFYEVQAANVESYRPRREAKVAKKVQRETDRQAAREVARAKALERVEATRAAAAERKAKRDAERAEREGNGGKVLSFADGKRKREEMNKQGGSDKGYVAISKARVVLEKAKAMVETAYQNKLNEQEKAEDRLDMIEARLKEIKREIKDEDLDIADERQTQRRGLMDEDPRAVRDFERAKKEALVAKQKLGFEQSRLKVEQIRMRAIIQKNAFPVKELKQLLDKVERARLKSNPIDELLRLETELRRNRVILPLCD
jgi:hypothetical protein